MTRLGTALALAALVFAAQTAQADDETAKKHYRTAVRHWRDPDPTKTAKYLEMAIEAADTKLLRLNLYLIFGQFHQGKTGEFEKARKTYAKVEAAIDSKTTDPRLLRLKASALLGRGAIVYTQTFDAKQALPLFVKGHELRPSPESADTLSQLYVRMGRHKATPAAERKKYMQVALEMAQDSLRLDTKRKRRMQAWTAKLRLQHVIVLTAMGNSDRAQQELELIDTAHFSPNTTYQEALLMALKKEPAGNIGAKLREGLSEKVRPGLQARNQFRGMIRTEPDFQPFLKQKGWKDLVTDEKPKPKAKPPTSRPAGGPGGGLGD